MSSIDFSNSTNRNFTDGMESSQTLRLISIGAVIITMALALFGNLFLGLIILKSPRRRLAPVQVFLLNLCIADIAFALVSLLPQLVITLTYPEFNGSNLTCKIIYYFMMVPMYASTFLLVAMAVDRYVAICKPLSALMWKYTRVHVLIAVSWILSLICSIPQLFIFRKSSELTCSANFGRTPEEKLFRSQLYTVAFGLLAWIIPTIIIAILYGIVCVTVWRSASAIRTPECEKARAKPRKKSRQMYLRESFSGKSSQLRRSSVSSANVHKIKTVKLTLTIVICNFILWSPFCLMHILRAFLSEAFQSKAALIFCSSILKQFYFFSSCYWLDCNFYNATGQFEQLRESLGLFGILLSTSQSCINEENGQRENFSIGLQC